MRNQYSKIFKSKVITSIYYKFIKYYYANKLSKVSYHGTCNGEFISILPSTNTLLSYILDHQVYVSGDFMNILLTLFLYPMTPKLDPTSASSEELFQT